MRLLLDQNLSPRLVGLLADAGHRAVHARDVGLRTASDATVLRVARDQGWVLITADTGLDGELARPPFDGPGVVIVRRISDRRAGELAGILMANLAAVEADLDNGAVVVLDEDRIVVRARPVWEL